MYIRQMINVHINKVDIALLYYWILSVSFTYCGTGFLQSVN